jgi:hypothetical protein
MAISLGVAYISNDCRASCYTSGLTLLLLCEVSELRLLLLTQTGFFFSAYVT